MILLGLTGGIASGKSTIAQRLEALGAIRIDADQLAREAVAPGSEGLELIAQRFGAEVIDASGSLDRAALGRLVFGNEEALADLNDIVHPAVRRLAAARIDAIEAENPDAVVVYEIPLLVETGTTGVGGRAWDLVVVADAPAELRGDRLRRFRGLSAPEAERRVASQVSDSARRDVADVVIDTSGGEHETIDQVDALWARITHGRIPPAS